jgi:2-polyprenyl-3-methyl-5-hydroxy-6-metoxy-1,4-benzoquinol methylase
MTADVAYTHEDHVFRREDPYARAKYDLTTRWVQYAQRSGGTLFHIGCGSGVFNRTASELGFRVRAFEPDADAAALAQLDAPPGLQIERLSLAEIEGECLADVIVMHDVLEHIEDDRDAVDDLRRLVRDTGTIVLSVPALPSLFGFHDEQLGHHRRYTKRTLSEVVDPKFRVVQLRYFGFSFIPVTFAVSKVLRRPYPTSSAARADALTGRAFAGLCRLETHVIAPLGTSLLAELSPRR